MQNTILNKNAPWLLAAFHTGPADTVTDVADTTPIRCGHCHQLVGAELILGETDGRHPGWLRCPSCGQGSVIAAPGGVVYPPSLPGSPVHNLPDDVGSAWLEARSAHAARAFTAAEIMCRKILMHVAVDVADAKEGKNFLAYVDALQSAGYITTGLKPVIDKIRARGNVANHELLASFEQESLTTLLITEHLLRSVYELPGLAEDAEGMEVGGDS